MKRIHIIICVLAVAALNAAAQTMNICTGSVVTAVTATADDMTYSSNGSILTVASKAFTIADIDSIYIDETTVADGTIDITYSGTTAKVIVAGNIAPYVTTTVSGANVTILQSADLAEEITYTLQGTATNGSFYMDGKLKASIRLNGLTLVSTDSAAINIRNGKRISVELVEGTTNSLTDAASGSQKGCFMVNGHTEFKGGGALTIAGKAKHAFWGDEYVELKKSVGSITITAAKKDGFNINQYFEMKGGTVTISGTGDDGIQVSATDDSTDENNGQVIISGGTLIGTITAAAAKGVKSDDAMTITGGTITITTTGAGAYDSSDKDAKGCCALKADGALTIDDGTFTLKSTGTGGKGISGDTNVTINGGTFNITTTGKKYSYSSKYTALPKGIKADNNLTINGGTLTITTSGGEGAEGMESKNTLTINDGTIIITAYDDAINASKNVTINGGNVYAYASNNDGIDSNGTLTVTGGVTLAIGTTSPEDGFDCDNNTFTITGGVLIGMGGDSSTPTASKCTQCVYLLSNKSYTKGKYLTLEDSSGNNIFAFYLPRTYSSAKLLVSCPSMTKGSKYVLRTGATVSGGTAWQGYTTGATVTGGTSISSFTLSSSSYLTSTSSSSSSNRP